MIKCCKNGINIEFDEISSEIKELSYEGKSYIGDTIPVFSISFMNKCGAGDVVCSSEFKLTGTEQSSDGFVCQYENSTAKVEMSVAVTDNISWDINVLPIDKEMTVEWVDYPQILVPDKLKDKDGGSKILWGFNEGVIVDDMNLKENAWGYMEPKYPSEGVMGLFPAIVETQFMAYYDETSGLYIAAHDNHNNLKGIDFYRYKNGIKLQFRHFTGADFGERYIMSYPMVTEFFKGEWQDAADIYRNWFEENHSDEFVPIERNKMLPKWYGESPVIVTYPVRGKYDTDVMTPNKLFPYENAMPYIKRLEKELNSKIMVILMHWEGTAPWAPPYVWPPFGGESALEKFIKEIHDDGNVIGVYCSGMGWTQHSNITDYDMPEKFENEHLESVMCVSPEQKLEPSKICTPQRAGYDMCPTQKFTVEVLKDQVQKMADAGLDYIQLLDQNHGGTSYFCYSHNHGHPPVPGKWQVDAVKRLLSVVKGNYPKLLLGCESAAAESYIPQLLLSDNRFNLNYRIGRPTPAYAYIYHKYVNNFMGNQVCANIWIDYDKSPENLQERIAYSFCAGDMLTIVLNDEGSIMWNWGQVGIEKMPDQKAIVELIKNLNEWRCGRGKKYIHSGDMVKPYRTISQKGRIARVGIPDLMCDKIYTCAWKSSDNTYGQFLVNYNKADEQCEVELPGNCKFKVYDNYGNFYAINGGKTKITVKGLSAVMIERDQ